MTGLSKAYLVAVMALALAASPAWADTITPTTTSAYAGADGEMPWNTGVDTDQSAVADPTGLAYAETYTSIFSDGFTVSAGLMTTDQGTSFVDAEGVVEFTLDCTHIFAIEGGLGISGGTGSVILSLTDETEMPATDVFYSSTDLDVGPVSGVIGPGDYVFYYYASLLTTDEDATGEGWASLELEPVPEPGTLALFGVAAAGLLVVRRRRSLARTR